jgi:tetratricopeptide (TPR) repeat protein
MEIAQLASEQSSEKIGWAMIQGGAAELYNELGNHQAALHVCTQALARLTPADLQYTSINLKLQIERAHAHAGLGQKLEAKRQLDALIAMHAPNCGALTLGTLHEARLVISLSEGDVQAAREHLAQMASWLRPTGIAALIERLQVLSAQVRRLDANAQSVSPPAAQGGAEEASLALLALSAASGSSRQERAQRALGALLELSGADAALFVLGDGPDAKVFSLGASADAELVHWARGVAPQPGSDPDEAETVLEDSVSTSGGRHQLRLGRLTWSAAPLWREHQGDRRLVGVLALGFARSAPRMVGDTVRRTIAEHLDARLA